TEQSRAPPMRRNSGSFSGSSNQQDLNAIKIVRGYLFSSSLLSSRGLFIYSNEAACGWPGSWMRLLRIEKTVDRTRHNGIRVFRRGARLRARSVLASATDATPRSCTEDTFFFQEFLSFPRQFPPLCCDLRILIVLHPVCNCPFHLLEKDRPAHEKRGNRQSRSYQQRTGLPTVPGQCPPEAFNHSGHWVQAV